MALTEATQDQVAELTRHCAMAHRSLQRARDGGMLFPMTDVDRNRLLNQLNAIAQDLEILGLVAEGGPALGPNDVVIDSTVPVPVRDQDTQVTGMAHVTLEDGAAPLIGFTGEDISLVATGTQVLLARAGGLAPVQTQLASGNPLTTSFSPEVVVSTPDGPGTLKSASEADHAAVVVGYDTKGGVQMKLASTAYAGIIANAETAPMRSYYEITAKTGATGRIQINSQRLNYFSTGPLCYPLVHNEVVTDPVSGAKYKFSIVQGRITNIEGVQ